MVSNQDPMDEAFKSMRRDAEVLASSSIVQVAKFGRDVSAMLDALSASVVDIDSGP